MSTEKHIETLSKFDDHRGVLMPLEFGDLSFVPARSFFVVQYGSFDNEKRVRGKSAAKSCQHYFYCIAGEVAVSLFDGSNKQTFHLRPGQGLFIDKMTWTSYLNKENVGRLCVFAVFASQPYDAADYITDIHEFKKLVTK